MEWLCIAFTWNSFLLNGAVFLAIGLIFIFLVKREKAEITEEAELAKKKAIQELRR